VERSPSSAPKGAAGRSHVWSGARLRPQRGPRTVATGGAEHADRRAERNPWNRFGFFFLPRRGRGIAHPGGGSVEYVLIVELDPVATENSQQLRLEIMVLGLPLHGLFLRLADAEDAVSVLPREIAQGRELFPGL